MAATAPYALPEGCFYIDSAAAALYAENAGDEIVMRQKVSVAPGAALDAWIKHAWLAGTEKEITPGEGRALVNHTRLVAGLGVEEQIRSAGLPSASDAAGAVPSVLYKVTKAAALPITDHAGLVRFVPDGDKAEIVWTIKLALSVDGNATFADPKGLPPFLVTAISGLLAKVAADIDAASQ